MVLAKEIARKLGLMRTMIDAFAEYERAIIRARTKAAMGHKRH